MVFLSVAMSLELFGCFGDMGNIDFYIHLSVSASIFLLLRELFNVKVSFILCFLVGVFKEQFYDVYHLHSDFDVIDIAANLIGITSALLLDYLVWKEKQ
jgi:hypothetical protein